MMPAKASEESGMKVNRKEYRAWLIEKMHPEGPGAPGPSAPPPSAVQQDAVDAFARIERQVHPPSSAEVRRAGNQPPKRNPPKKKPQPRRSPSSSVTSDAYADSDYFLPSPGSTPDRDTGGETGGETPPLYRRRIPEPRKRKDVTYLSLIPHLTLPPTCSV